MPFYSVDCKAHSSVKGSFTIAAEDGKKYFRWTWAREIWFPFTVSPHLMLRFQKITTDWNIVEQNIFSCKKWYKWNEYSRNFSEYSC